jgi:phosphonate transport system substrate-binding protein
MNLTRLLAAAALMAVTATSAHADWRDDMAELRIGVVAPGGGGYRVAQLQPFRAYLETRLGVPVEIVAEPNLDALIAAQAKDDVQYAIHTAASFAIAAARCHCVEPVAAPKAGDGALGYYAVLVVKAGSPIKALDDARDARLAVGPADSVAGRLVPLGALTRTGIAPEKFFASLVEEPDPEEAIAALFTGSADAALAWSSLTGDAANGYDFGALTEMIGSGRLQPGSLRVVWQSPLIPFGPHAVRSDMAPELKQLIVEALEAMGNEAPDALEAVDRAGYGGGGFAPVTADLYAPLADLARADPMSR